MGAVIDAIPRITADANGNFTEIAFEPINAYDYEVQDLYDGSDNAEGDGVEEGQYNRRFPLSWKTLWKNNGKKRTATVKCRRFSMCERLFVRPVLF